MPKNVLHTQILSIIFVTLEKSIDSFKFSTFGLMTGKLHLKEIVLDSVATEISPTDLAQVKGGFRLPTIIRKVRRTMVMDWTSEKVTGAGAVYAERRFKGDNPLWDLLP